MRRATTSGVRSAKTGGRQRGQAEVNGKRCIILPFQPRRDARDRFRVAAPPSAATSSPRVAVLRHRQSGPVADGQGFLDSRPVQSRLLAPLPSRSFGYRLAAVTILAASVRAFAKAS